MLAHISLTEDIVMSPWSSWSNLLTITLITRRDCKNMYSDLGKSSNDIY